MPTMKIIHAMGLRYYRREKNLSREIWERLLHSTKTHMLRLIIEIHLYVSEETWKCKAILNFL